MGHMTVTATRDVPLIDSIVVTASRLSPSFVLVADLGAMTVTASSETVLIADLGEMIVSARREIVLARK